MKKIITLLVALCLILNSAVLVNAADKVIFADMKSSHYALEAATGCYKHGLVNTSTDGNYHPSHHVTTADICDILYRFCIISGDTERGDSSHIPELQNKDDVVYGAWYYEALVWAVKECIVTPESEDHFGTFSSYDHCSILNFLNKALNSANIELKYVRDVTVEIRINKDDFTISEEDKALINHFAKAGIIAPNNIFFPDGTFSKGSMAIVFNNLIKAVPPSETIDRPAKYDEINGHKNKHFDGISPTCTEYGIMEYEGCTTCDYTDRRITYINPKNHRNLDVKFIEKFETRTEPGIRYGICSVCGELNDRQEFYHDIYYMDVDPNKWYYLPIKYVDLFSLMNGVSEFTFSPDTDMSRAMLVTVLYRLAGSQVVSGSTPFTDLSSTHNWYRGAVLWAYQNDIVKGTSETTFSPDATVTREQLATILYRFTEKLGLEVTSNADITSFPDSSKVSAWAREAVAWAYGEGIVTGALVDGEVCLEPLAGASRAQVATVLMRYCER